MAQNVTFISKKPILVVKITSKIHFLTDSGRLCRPMYVLEDNQIKISAELVTALKSGKLNWSNLVSGINYEICCCPI